MEGQKTSYGLVIALTVFVVLTMCLGGYIIYDKLNVKSNNNSTNEPNANNNNNLNPNTNNNSNGSNTNNNDSNIKEESVTFSDSELEKYVNYISADLIYDTNYVNARELSAAEKIRYIASHISSQIKSTSDYKYSVIAENDVKSIVEKIYGPNSYQKTTFSLGCGEFTLNESNGNYYAKSGCGDDVGGLLKSNVVIDYKATKSKLEITTAYVFYDYYATQKIYKDSNKNIVLDNYTIDASVSEIQSYLKEYAKNNKNKLYHIVYNFESNDGINYYFTGFTNNK